MPSNKKLDDAKILAVFDRLQNGRAVARELNLHEQSVYTSLRRTKGVCTRCGGDVVAGRKSCKTCLEFDKARMKEMRAERRRFGLCQQCGVQRSPLSKLFCETHRIAAATRNETYRTRLRGASKPGVPNLRQKHRSMKNNYGPAAIDCWNEAEGTCESCGAAHADTSIHIHHIDEDRKNNARENFACLCFYCHNAVHALINSSSRTGLIAWFEKTYPERPLR